MSERLNRLLEYEKRLLEDRQLLMELVAEKQNMEQTDSGLIDCKLEHFQRELAFMKYHLEMLKSDVRVQEAKANTETRAESKTETRAEANAESKTETRAESKIETRAEANTELRAEAKTKVIRETPVAQRIPEKKIEVPTVSVKKDLEKAIGKSLMGIFASVLIFISLILFATLLLPYFNDTAKMITTYVVSFAFLSVGVVKLRKDPDNKFFIALTGCGMGALYISLLLSNMYFKVIGDILLYVLICVWGIGVSIFAKKHNKLFQIIGELGILISMIFGTILCVNQADSGKFFALIIFYVISSGVFYFLHYEEEFKGNLVHHICNTITILFLSVSCFQFSGEALYQKEIWMVLALVLVSFGCTLVHKQETEGVSFSIFACVYLIVAALMVEGLCANDSLCGRVYYFATLPLLALMEWRKADCKEGKYIVQGLLVAIAIIGLLIWEYVFCYSAVPMLILPLLIVGYLLKNSIFLYGSLIAMFIYLYTSYPIGEVGHFIWATIAAVFGYVMLYWKKKQYRKAFKIGLYLYSLLVLLISFPDMVYKLSSESALEMICTYIALTCYNIAMMKSVFGKNLLTGEPEAPALYNIVNMVLMMVGLYWISDGYEGIYHFLFIITTLVTFLINSKNLLDRRDNMVGGIYVGIKFTVFMIVILNSFDSVNYMISIACLLLAIASIILGFVGEYKSLRIFGLVLSMISIFKLIMIDISYENTLGNALSFFVSGILCFVISLIYNYIDKRVKERA